MTRVPVSMGLLAVQRCSRGSVYGKTYSCECIFLTVRNTKYKFSGDDGEERQVQFVQQAPDVALAHRLVDGLVRAAFFIRFSSSLASAVGLAIISPASFIRSSSLVIQDFVLVLSGDSAAAG